MKLKYDQTASKLCSQFQLAPLHLGVTIAPLICGLVALTLLLLLCPPLERALTRVLDPAVTVGPARYYHHVM